MIDYRIHTFLKLCELMNYRKTAEVLNMSQPGVTQHIHALEEIYNTKLFNYNGKKLELTKNGELLALHARSLIFNDDKIKKLLKHEEIINLKIGVTKTIGEYIICDKIAKILNDKTSITLDVANTQDLLKKLNNFSLDLLLVEGFFDKKKYGYELFKQEEMVILCSKNHPLNKKEVEIDEIFSFPLLLREEGSGTRAVAQSFLNSQNHSFDSFKHKSTINNFKIIETIVENTNAISFVYKVIAENSEKLGYFKIKNYLIEHELNYVFLKNTKSKDLIRLFNNL